MNTFTWSEWANVLRNLNAFLFTCRWNTSHCLQFGLTKYVRLAAKSCFIVLKKCTSAFMSRLCTVISVKHFQIAPYEQVSKTVWFRKTLMVASVLHCTKNPTRNRTQHVCFGRDSEVIYRLKVLWMSLGRATRLSNHLETGRQLIILLHAGPFGLDRTSYLTWSEEY